MNKPTLQNPIKKSKKKILTQERLKELLDYDPNAGIFRWKVRTSNRIKVGDVAGYKTPGGYIDIKVDNHTYGEYRLAFLFMEGFIPENEVDHINRITDDDRWINLRHVSHQCNIRNSKVSKRNKSGVTGVFWLKQGRKWYSCISLMKKTKRLGDFENKEDAVKARWKAEVELGYPGCNSCSSAYLYLKRHCGAEMEITEEELKKSLDKST